MTDPNAVTLGVNHVVLWVRDAEASASFYEQVLALVRVAEMPGGVFLRAPDSGNDHDLALFSTPNPEPGQGPSRAIGMYHMAWEVPTLAVLQGRMEVLRELGALVGASDHGTTKSLYGHDPDGIEFEIMWQVPRRLLGARDEMTTQALDLAGAIERFGAETLSGERATAAT